MKEKERKYVLAITATIFILIIWCIISFVLGFIDAADRGTILENTFEIIYMTFHLIVLVVCSAFCFAALKGNSYHVMRNLMYQEGYKVPSKGARIVCIVFSSFNFVLTIYFALTLLGVNLPYFNFSVFLRMILVNTPLTVFIIPLFFVFYPLVYNK